MPPCAEQAGGSPAEIRAYALSAGANHLLFGANFADIWLSIRLRSVVLRRGSRGKLLSLETRDPTAALLSSLRFE